MEDPGLCPVNGLSISLKAALKHLRYQLTAQILEKVTVTEHNVCLSIKWTKKWQAKKGLCSETKNHRKVHMSRFT